MKQFRLNIINMHGEKGKAWLDSLEQNISDIAARLGLRDLNPVANLTCNYVLKGYQGHSPIILKFGIDEKALKKEAVTLKALEGHGAVKVLHAEAGELVLGCAQPGNSLKDYFPERDLEGVNIFFEVMRKLHKAPVPKDFVLPHIRDLLAALDKDFDIDDLYLKKARFLREELLASFEGDDVLLHGDLHHDNILKHYDDWVVIDPMGVVGEPAYEVGAFMRNPISNLLDNDPHLIIKNRIKKFAELLAAPEARLVKWCFVQAVLCCIWALEDNCDTSYWRKITHIFYDML